ncbi:MAG TPA: cytochrome c oxidase assembly protein [Caulobacteraceae bacterium]|nr:cytochrome c oxidase assembly protein [Caulobacteraceae bacterium]
MAISAPIGAFPYHPYCGAPPAPDDIWRRWNLDPVLLAALATIWVGYLFLARRRELTRRQQALFSVGWSLTSLALICPICPLSVALFSARVGQHMFLVSVAAPLVASGWPPREGSPSSARWSPILAAGAFAAALWIWHSPVPYVATFQSTAIYWLMHLTTFGAALWLWRSIFFAWRRSLEGAAVAILVTVLQMGVLGAVITFAPRPLYAPHLYTAMSWGLTPLQDQQLGGVIMWVPAGVLLAAVLAAGFAEALSRSEPRVQARPAT